MLPPPLAWLFATALGLVFGSFLNVCIARLPRHRSVAWPGSQCPRCLAQIRPRDNLPVLSWLLLRGRCRACGQPISIRYPLVELVYAALLACCLARFGFSPEAGLAACFCFLALGLLVMDLETMLLPDSFTLPGIALGVLGVLALHWARGSDLPAASRGAGDAALAAAAWALVPMGIRWAYHRLRGRHGLGLGDVKLVAMLAAWLGGSRTALCFLLAIVSAAGAGVGLILLQRSRSTGRAQSASTGRASEDGDWRVTRIPLGAFLCAAGLYALFFGEQTIRWYLRFWT